MHPTAQSPLQPFVLEKWTWGTTYQDLDCELVSSDVPASTNFSPPLLAYAHSQGVKVTADDLADLVKSLGLGDEHTNDLISGLDFSSAALLPADNDNRSTPASSRPQSPSTHEAVIVHEASDESHDEVDEPEAGGEHNSDSENSDLGDLPPTTPRLRVGIQARKRTDERPLTSPLTPSGSTTSLPNVPSVLPASPKTSTAPSLPPSS